MSRRFRAVQITLGVILLGTAALKLYGLSVSALSRVGWFAQPWVQLAVAEWELVLGEWLLSGSYPRAAWLAALVTFAAFAAVSGYQGWVGVASCGCFGTIHASPWWAFGFDLAVISTLVLSRPTLHSPEDQLRPQLTRAGGEILALFVGAAVLFGFVAGFGAWHYGSLDAALASLRGERISVRPGFVNVGSGAPGETLQATVEVVNRTDRAVRIVGGTSDCSCVTTSNLPLTLEPGESRVVLISVRLPGSPGVFNRQAILAALASSPAVRANDSADCEQCCSALGYTGYQYQTCVANCQLGYGDCGNITKLSKCPNADPKACSFRNGDKGACDGSVCVEVGKGQCDCIYDKGTTNCNCPQ